MGQDNLLYAKKNFICVWNMAFLCLINYNKGIEFLQQTQDFLIPISLQSNLVNLRHFKQWIMLDQILNYQTFSLSGCKGIGIRKLMFVAQILHLCMKYDFLMFEREYLRY